MRQLAILLSCLGFFSSLRLNAQSTLSEFVSLKGKTFQCEGANFYPVVMNYVVDIVRDASNNKYIIPHHSYGTTNDYEQATQTAAFNALVADFQMLRNEGFNAIRLVGLPAGAYCTNNTNPCTALSTTIAYHSDNYTFTSPQNTTITSPYTDMFTFTDQALLAAQQADIKVILLVGGKAIDDSGINAQFTAYLQALTTHLKDNATLMAYDFYNEPLYFDLASYSKGQVCDMVKAWTNVVHTNAPNHLTTIGLASPGETGEWDPGVLDIDFASFHPYPDVNEIGGNQTDALNRVKSMIYWMGQTCTIPWILGETGFAASDNIGYTADSGTPTDQQNYADQTLDYCRNCGGSGYSWWQMYDVWWGSPKEDYLGLVTHTPSWKQAGTEFQTFNPWGTGPCTQPANYYNGYNNSAYVVHGYVRDQNNQPIANALIDSWTSAWGYDGGTYTDAAGHFDLYAANPIAHIRSTAQACGSQWSWNVTNGGTYNHNLNRFSATPSYSLNNVTVPTGQWWGYEASDYINATNYTITGNGTTGATVAMKATNVIRLQSGFIAQKGSNFTAVNGPVRPDCNYVTNNLRRPDNDPNMVHPAGESISRFEPVNNPAQVISVEQAVPAFVIAPNPNNGTFSVLSRSSVEARTVKVMNVVGETVFEASNTQVPLSIDLSMQPKGIYLVLIMTDTSSFTERVVVQ